MIAEFNIVDQIAENVVKVAGELEGFPRDFQPDIRVADPKFGDFQINGVLPLAKELKTNPRVLGTQLLEALESSDEFPKDVFAFTIAGPGFINIKLSPKLYTQWLSQYKDEAAYQMAAKGVYEGKTISVDYSSPNTAKQMHVGHIRSMVIGESIQRILRFCGAKIIRDNHIGDWGTQFGILILAIKEFNYNLDAEHADVLEDLEKLYQEGTKLFESSEEKKEQARSELLKLQQGDADNVALWEKIIKVSYDAFNEIYKQLGIEFDVVQGESFYRDQVDRIYKELLEAKIAEESEGALIVFHETGSDKPYPFIIRKKDGASNYASTDLATIAYHAQENDVDQMIYVTDGRQQDHFKHLFLTAQAWFEAKKYRLPKLRHVWFGTILGEDGKAIKTRSGTPIKLKELLKEGIDRAYKLVEEKNPNLSPTEKQNIARVVGLGAIRYADLSQNRTSDYTFSWDKILSFDGNTAPYLLYAIARIHSIFNKIGIRPGDGEDDASELETDEELALAKKLMEFPLVIEQVTDDLRPHYLCTYLFQLAGEFSTFYNANKVISDEAQTQARRLMLCSRTLNTLTTGLHLLGLETLERM